MHDTKSYKKRKGLKLRKKDSKAISVIYSKLLIKRVGLAFLITR